MKAPFALRPLGFAELVDRAISIYVRAFVPLAAVALVSYVPAAITRAFDGRGLVVMLIFYMRGLAGVVSINPLHRPSSVVATIVDAAIAFFIVPLVSVTLVEIVMDAASGRRVAIRNVARRCRDRYRPLIVLTFFYACVHVASCYAGIVVIRAVADAFPRTPGSIRELATAVDTFVLATGLCVLFPFDLSVFACVCERTSARRALRAGLRIVRRRRVRAVLSFGTYAAILIALQTLFATLIRGVATVTSPPIAYALATAVVLLLDGIRFAFLAAVYLDMRIRDDGYDLLVAARALGSPLEAGAR